MLDPTRVQFLEFRPNYDDGVRAGFLTLTLAPSKRAQRLIELMVWKDPDAIRNVRMRGKFW